MIENYQYNRDSIGEELLLYIRDDIPAKLLKYYLETTLKMCQLKLIHKKESGFSMAVTIRIKTKLRIIQIT